MTRPQTDGRPDDTAADRLWTPPEDVLERTRVGRFLGWLEETRGLALDGYHELWEWSVTDLDGFWSAVREFFDLGRIEHEGPAILDRSMPGTRWFPGLRLNYAEEALRRGGADDVAVIARVQGEADRSVTRGELRDLVARCRGGLIDLGVGPGDTVAAYLGNRIETLVAFLATASLGALWASCPPEFGASGAIGRLGQLDPKVLFAQTAYRYGDRVVDRRADFEALVGALPEDVGVIMVEVPDGAEAAPAEIVSMRRWDDLMVGEPRPGFEAVPFDHPLFVLFSSGTTGPPKAIVHGHGGIVLEHVKALALHLDLGPEDRFFWFSTTGWMMWNFLVSGLLVGSTVVLFDGDPVADGFGALWQLAEDVSMTYFGSSAPFLLACRDREMVPMRTWDLGALRGVGSTGAPLPAAGFRWVYEAVAPDGLLGSISGGTDVCTAFVGASPLLPVVAGRIPGAMLGARVEAFDENDEPVIGRPGELVLTEPLPSMPVAFWGDSDGEALTDAYFAERPGVWTHGDWITFLDDGSLVISGRSDATLNRGGVRMGTAELYAVVEEHPAVADSLVVHLEDPAGGAGELVLFVVPSSEDAIGPAVVDELVRALRSGLSPRHAPDRVEVVPGIPRTRSGKKLEIPVKKLLQGRPVDEVLKVDSVDDETLLEPFVRFAADLGRRG